MYEVGYKGTLNNKWSITTDLYYTKRDNNLTPAQQASSLVVYPTAGADLAAIVAAAIPADSAARFGRTPAQIGAMYKSAVESLTLKNGVPSPLGLLSSDQSPTGKTLDLTYFNLEAIDYWGADLGIVYNATPEISVFANYSHLSQVYWEKAKIKNSTSTTAFSLNQPADRFRIGGDYVRAKGFLCNVAVRYASKWTGVNGTAWSGEIPAYTIVDAGLGYAFSPKMKVNVTVTNVLDSKYSVLANAPNIGRLILAKGTVSF
jgi:outer membrane receptor protein involved in Fe transport